MSVIAGGSQEFFAAFQRSLPRLTTEESALKQEPRARAPQRACERGRGKERERLLSSRFPGALCWPSDASNVIEYAYACLFGEIGGEMKTTRIDKVDEVGRAEKPLGPSKSPRHPEQEIYMKIG